MNEATPGVPPILAQYILSQDRRRADRVGRVYSSLPPNIRQLVKDVAVMGYVRGLAAGRNGDYNLPLDSVVVAEVIDACLTFPDLYPAVSAIEEMTRPSREESAGQGA